MSDHVSSEHSQPFRFPKGTTIAVLLIVAAVCCCYGNALHSILVSDDYYIIGTNRLRFNLQTILHCLTTSDSLISLQPCPYYRPLARLLFILEQEFFGSNAIGYHVVSILLHGFSSALVYLTLLRLRCARLPSLLAALLFALHPVNTEAVNLIAARNNILATIFTLWSFHVMCRADETRSKTGYFMSGLLFFAGTLCKETALMFLPFLFFIKTIRRSSFRNLKELLNVETGYILPHVVFACIYLVLRYIVLDQSFNLAGLSGRWRTMVYMVPKYLSLIAFPVDQSFAYTVPEDLATARWLIIGGWVTFLILLYYVFRRRNRIIEFAAAWIFLNFLPISHIVPLASWPLADRYLYTPLVGFALIVGDGLSSLDRRSARRAGVWGTILVIIAFGYSSWTRNKVWKNDASLCASLLKQHPTVPDFHAEMGFCHFLNGDKELARQELETALRLGQSFRDAPWAYYYLSTISLNQGDTLQAMRHLLKAEDTGNTRAHIRYTIAALSKTQSRQDALEQYRQFLALPGFAMSHLLPEARNEVLRLRGIQQPAERPEEMPLSAPWKVYYRLPSGSEFSYHHLSDNKSVGSGKIEVRYRLAPKDRLQYMMNFIRFPLKTMTEVRFEFDVKCQLHVYRMLWSEYRDKDGNFLGGVNPDSDDFLRQFYLYPPQGTSMDGLLDMVCTDQDMQAVDSATHSR